MVNNYKQNSISEKYMNKKRGFFAIYKEVVKNRIIKVL